MGVSEAKLEKAKMTVDDWMLLTNRPGRDEKEMIRLLDWFIKNYPSGGITMEQYKHFFPASGTGECIATLVFR